MCRAPRARAGRLFVSVQLIAIERSAEANRRPTDGMDEPRHPMAKAAESLASRINQSARDARSLRPIKPMVRVGRRTVGAPRSLLEIANETSNCLLTSAPHFFNISLFNRPNSSLDLFARRIYFHTLQLLAAPKSLARGGMPSFGADSYGQSARAILCNSARADPVRAHQAVL